MATVETAPAGFVRQDGKEKVTGTGRYTADLSFTGMAHAKFRYADHSHAKILRIDTSKAKALPGVVAVVTQDDLPDVRYGGFVQDRYLFAKDVVRFEGEIVAGVAALTEEIAAEAARLIEIEYEPLPVVTDFVAAMEPRRDAGPPRPPVLRQGREHRRRRQHDGLPHDREGRCRRRDGGGRRRRQEPLRLRRVAGGADRAPRGRRAMAGRQGHDLVLDAGAVRRSRRRRADAPGARGGRAGRRPAPRRRVRREVRPALRGAGRRARPSRPAARPPGPVARGGVHDHRAAPRGDRDGLRDRRDAGRPSRRAPGEARPGQGRVLRRGRVPRTDGRDARVRAVPDRPHLGRGVPELHEQPAVRLGPRADGAAGVLGARAAHGRGRGRDRHGPRRPPPSDADRGRRRGPDATGVRQGRYPGHAREGRRDDRVRPRSARRRGDRGRGRVVAVHAGARPARTCR